MKGIDFQQKVPVKVVLCRVVLGGGGKGGSETPGAGSPAANQISPQASPQNAKPGCASAGGCEGGLLSILGKFRSAAWAGVLCSPPYALLH